MFKRILVAMLLILIGWSVIDVNLHRLILQAIYDSSAGLWRSIDKMNIPLIYVATIGLIAAFVTLYQKLVRPKSLSAGIQLGAIFGLALGIASGLGTYIHMPIPIALAWGWLIGAIVKGLAAGAIVGLFVVDEHRVSLPAGSV